MTSSAADLVAATTRFCRALREAGVAVTPAETIDAARALELVDLGDRGEVYLALRAVLATRPEDYPIFDDAFERLWRLEREPPRAAAAPTSAPPAPAVPRPTVKRPPPARAVATLERWLKPDAPTAGEPHEVPFMSEREALGTKDFSAFAPTDLAAVTRVARRIARRLARRPSRRWRAAPRGTRLHLRRTVRQSLKTGGDVAELAFKERKLRKTKLVALCDVSGSMDVYSRFLLQFLFALQNAFARVETFVFSTRLSRVTEQLTGARWADALGRLARDVHDWSGGTRVGASIAAFNTRWARLVDARTVVVILSDGWDTGDPAELAEAMRVLRRRAGRVVWLNPLLGSPTYRPLTRGMQAALPHVDVFAPAHNLESLERLARHLTL